MKLYCIKDLKGDFGVPYCFDNDDIAIRNLPFLVESNPIMKRYPEDFSLFGVGEFSYESGIIDAYPTPVFITNLPKEE